MKYDGSDVISLVVNKLDLRVPPVKVLWFSWVEYTIIGLV